MSRARPALRPPTPAAIAKVPAFTVTGELYRAQWAGRGPWWFSSRTANPEAGRFDLPAPEGTCHLADDPIAAMIEKLVDPEQEHPLVDHDTLGRLRVWSASPAGRQPLVADTTQRASRIPKELGTVVPYDLTWQWADALRAAGHGGIRYWLRLDPGSGRGIALFGPHGEAAPFGACREEPALAYLDQFRDIMDIVDPVPALESLTAASEP